MDSVKKGHCVSESYTVVKALWCWINKMFIQSI